MQRLTTGKPSTLLRRFALPLIAGQIVEVLYGYTDLLIVQRAVGVNAFAGVGSVISFVHLVMGFCLGMANAVGILAAQRYGAGDDAGVRRTLSGGLWVCVSLGLLVALLSALSADSVLRWLHTPEEIVGHARAYLGVVLGGAPLAVLGLLLPCVLRALGDSRSPVRYQIIATVLNVLLDLLFVCGFGWGVPGAAAATVAAQTLSAALCARRLWRSYPQARLTRAELRPAHAVIRGVLALGVPIGFQQSVVEIGNLCVQAEINRLGVTAVAAITAAHRIRELNMLPLFCLGMAVSAYVAQNHGAGLPGRVRAGVRSACGMAALCGALMAALNLLAGRYVVALLLPDSPEAAAMASRYLNIVGCFLPVLGVMLALRDGLQGMGRKRAPTLAGVAELAASLLCAFALIPALGFTGACFANPIAWLFSSLPLVVAYLRWLGRARQMKNAPEAE